MAICWERAVPLAFYLCCSYFSAVLVVRVPFPFGVWGRVWNSIVPVPDHCLFILFQLHKNCCGGCGYCRLGRPDNTVRVSFQKLHFNAMLAD